MTIACWQASSCIPPACRYNKRDCKIAPGLFCSPSFASSRPRAVHQPSPDPSRSPQLSTPSREARHAVLVRVHVCVCGRRSNTNTHTRTAASACQTADRENSQRRVMKQGETAPRWEEGEWDGLNEGDETDPAEERCWAAKGQCAFREAALITLWPFEWRAEIRYDGVIICDLVILGKGP